MRKLFLSAVMAALALSCGPSQSREAAFEKDIEAYRKEIGNVGLAVAVVKNYEIVYHHEFGVADRETGAPIQENSLFRIASISKSFSATSIMRVKVVWRSAAVVASPVRIWSLMVRMTRARNPRRAAFM